MLSGLLKTAETLKVKGLAEVSGDQPAAQVANPIPPILRLGVSFPFYFISLSIVLQSLLIIRFRTVH